MMDGNAQRNNSYKPWQTKGNNTLSSNKCERESRPSFPATERKTQKVPKNVDSNPSVQKIVAYRTIHRIVIVFLMCDFEIQE